jgi:hypothetical protein
MFNISRQCHHKPSLLYPGNLDFQSVGLRGDSSVQCTRYHMKKLLDLSFAHSFALRLERGMTGCHVS